MSNKGLENTKLKLKSNYWTTQVSIWLSRSEDFIYFATGLVLIGAAIVLLVAAVWNFVQLFNQDLRTAILQTLDNLLLVLMLVEILHTVGISLREHSLSSEPLLVIGLIATIRRILIITAEQARPTESLALEFRLVMLELGLLTLLVVAFVFAIYLLRKGEETPSQ